MLGEKNVDLVKEWDVYRLKGIGIYSEINL
jgi:hypothetical protein